MKTPILTFNPARLKATVRRQTIPADAQAMLAACRRLDPALQRQFRLLLDSLLAAAKAREGGAR
jgi:hypothetical protein